MTITEIIIIAYGLLLLVGGFMGYKAGSKVSLIMGTVSGLLVFVGVYWSHLSPKNSYFYLAIVSAVLIGAFLQRYVKTKKFMPGGLLGLISLIIFVICLQQFLKF